MVEKRQSGSRWRPRTAADFNAVSEVADDYQRRKRLGEVNPLGRKDPRQTSVFAQNVSGGDRRRGEVLEIGDLLPLALDDDSPDFKGKLPELDGSAFGILRKAAPEDHTELLQVVGTCIARVNFSDNAHNYAVLDAGKAVLKSSGVGPVKILWKPDPEEPEEEGGPVPLLGDVECEVLLNVPVKTWIVWIHLDVVTAADRSAIASINGLPPGTSLGDVPDIGKDPAPEGTIKVCDPIGCWLTGPAEDHVGREGWAIYQLPQKPTLCQPDLEDPDADPPIPPLVLEPEWMIQWLCCPIVKCPAESEESEGGGGEGEGGGEGGVP